jgi:hypothetical protein
LVSMASTVLVGYPPQRRQNSNAITGSGRTGSLLSREARIATRSWRKPPVPLRQKSS